MNLTFADDGPIVYNGPSIVDQFAIGVMTSKIDTNQHSTKLTLSISLRRIPTNHLLKTIIPTLLLCLLGYSTLFVDIRRPGDRFMGAVTIMLVLATWINVIGSDLPKTSYMKLVDLWFVWHVIMTFIIIIYHIFLDRISTNSILKNITKVEPCQQVNGDNGMMTNNEERTAKKMNRIVIILVSIINCIFYLIYFFLALI